MKGTKHVRISNRVAKYDFELKRNITIVRGDSGTGKSTLFNMVLDYTRNKDKSGVNLSSPCDCVAVYSDWKIQLRNVSNSIIFIDEDYHDDFLKTKDFAKYVQKSDNYFVLITREDLHELPYSVEEIYSIKMSGKYHRFKKIYKSTLENGYYRDTTPKTQYRKVLTEDSKAGHQFFEGAFKDKNVECLAPPEGKALPAGVRGEKGRIRFAGKGFVGRGSWRKGKGLFCGGVNEVWRFEDGYLFESGI